ncbi:4Fe-4S binding protein [Clostridium folliculivorans]|uniref:(Fe-S)-binding protein n=1 Tax=Clostridium folliculivorans TaxID=2886038 RepID=A0A9W5XXY9_9CLOT|nr:4Fe-4S binding protein [Clostridium folliculivorans]GKU23196.1 (Fe-S)-binding protein [Clostridium folliculivorans]GKU29242.1 (Fe-S)-binding protein [Clostridium folliculivorans]
MKSFLKFWKKYSYILLITFIILGLFDFRIGLFATICMVAPIIVSLFKGRFWCGNLCPRGSFYDNVVSKFSRKRKVPAFLKSVFFRSLVTILMLTVFTTGMIKNWGNLYEMGFVVYRLIVVTTIIGIVLSLFYTERTWCNFCPMGSLAALISKFKNRKNRASLLQVENSCVSCRLCEKNCPMGISPYHYKNGAIDHPDCIQCKRCVYKCPKKSINYNNK